MALFALQPGGSDRRACAFAPPPGDGETDYYGSEDLFVIAQGVNEVIAALLESQQLQVCIGRACLEQQNGGDQKMSSNV